MPSTLQLFKDNPNPVFVESGSYTGEGIQNALDAGFQRVISIEISQSLYRSCTLKFKNNPKVELILGDSGLILKNILENIKDPITFWLDGHFSGGNTSMGESETPIIKELQQIPIGSSNIILIDDIDFINSFDISRDYLENMIQNINNYTISYTNGPKNSTIMVCNPKKDNQ